MGLHELESVDEFVAINYRHYQTLSTRADRHGRDRTLALSEEERCNTSNIVLEVDESRAGLNRNDRFEFPCRKTYEQGAISFPALSP